MNGVVIEYKTFNYENLSMRVVVYMHILLRNKYLTAVWVTWLLGWIMQMIRVCFKVCVVLTEKNYFYVMKYATSKIKNF